MRSPKLKAIVDSFHSEAVAFVLLLIFFVLSPILTVFTLFDYYGLDRGLSVFIYLPYILALCSYLFNDGAGKVYKVFYYLHLGIYMSVAIWSLFAFEQGVAFYLYLIAQIFLALIGCVFAYLLITKKADSSMW